MIYYCKYFNPNFIDAIESLGVAPLVHLLDSYGRWPMTVTNWTGDVFDWKKTSAHIRNTLGENCNTHQGQLPTTLPSNAATTNTTNF